jgi:predicted NUDIX family phosphoesterase
MEIHKNIAYIPDGDSFKVFIDDTKNFGNENKSHIQLLSNLEKIEISKIIDKNKDKIMAEWLNNYDMKKFYNKYNITNEEITEYI